jgi:ABC-2 type transport system permease protein
VALLIAISAVLSLVTIISIYREGGILKRLRATPLRPQTILSAHVIVKLVLTTATLALMFLAGKRYFPPGADVPWFSFTIALLISTWSILSVGFVIASIVPTARFAQPVGAVILYPMIAFCGLFVPISHLPPVLRYVARVLPLTYAVRLLQGIWIGDGWLAHLGDVAASTVLFLLFTAISAKIFAGNNKGPGCEGGYLYSISEEGGPRESDEGAQPEYTSLPIVAPANDHEEMLQVPAPSKFARS